MSVRLLFASELLLGKESYTRPDGTAGYGYLGCGVSSDFNLTMLATDNEAGQNKYARQMGKYGRRGVLKRGWRAFKSKPDANGLVDRDDIPRVHAAMFPGLPQPMAYNTSASWAWKNIGPRAHSLAIDTRAVGGGDAIRRYVGGFPHQVVVYKRKVINKVRYVKIVDPMHPQSDLYTGHWVRWSSLRKCAERIGGGRFLGFHAPVGGWTRAAIVRRRKNEVIKRTESDLQTMTDARDKAVAARDEAVDEVGRLTAENRALEEQLSECRDDRPDVAAALDAVEERVGEAIASVREDYE